MWKITGKMPHTLLQAPTLCGNLQEKTRMDIAQGPFCVEIYRKNAANPRPHLDLHGPLFTLTVRTPSVWPHCLGKNSVVAMFHGYVIVTEKARRGFIIVNSPFKLANFEYLPGSDTPKIIILLIVFHKIMPNIY